MNYNRMILGGNLTRDPELRYTPSNTPICSASLAVNRRVKRGEEWVDEASFFDLVIWGKRGEAFAKYHEKGQAAFVEGYAKQERWEDKKTGGNRSKVVCVVEDWQFAGAAQPRKVSAGGGGDEWPGGPDDDPIDVSDTPF